MILLGTPQSNAVLAQIAARLPVHFGGDGIILGGKTYAGADQLLVLAYPNPLQPDRYVGVLGASSPKAFAGVQKIGRSHPDYSIRDVKGEVVVEGLFDIFWQPAASK